MDNRTNLKTAFTLLLECQVGSKHDLRQWYELAHKAELLAKETSIEIPHLVWHYLSDADIRFKEPEYGQEQIEAACQFVNSLGVGSTGA